MFKKAYKKLCKTEGDLSKENLRELFGNLEDQAFEDVYCLFDWDNDGSVDVHEFVLTMSLLATPATSFDAEQDLLFAIFDVDGSGTMDREEVRRSESRRKSHVTRPTFLTPSTPISHLTCYVRRSLAR